MKSLNYYKKLNKTIVNDLVGLTNQEQKGKKKLKKKYTYINKRQEEQSQADLVGKTPTRNRS